MLYSLPRSQSTADLPVAYLVIRFAAPTPGTRFVAPFQFIPCRLDGSKGLVNPARGTEYGFAGLTFEAIVGSDAATASIGLASSGSVNPVQAN